MPRVDRRLRSAHRRQSSVLRTVAGLVTTRMRPPSATRAYREIAGILRPVVRIYYAARPWLPHLHRR